MAAESAIVNDRRTGKGPNNEARGWYLLDSNEGLRILMQRELAQLHPSSTPQDLRATTHEGYCSVIEAGVARDTMSALELLEHNNGIELTLLAKLGRVHELSHLEFVKLANRKATRDKLLQLQEVIPTLPSSCHCCHFQHYSHNQEHNIGDCYDQMEHAPTSEALQSWGLRVQSTGTSQGNGASPAAFVHACQYLTVPGYHPASRSSSTKLHYSAATTRQVVESMSEGGSEELSL